MIENRKRFSCVIVGGRTLPIRCAEILLDAGHEIIAIGSDDSEVKKWAKAQDILCLVPSSDLADQINAPFDYLFSIVNEHILRRDILRLPRKLAINYHDAPLPRYAGTHATSWALMNRETIHGISWHIISDVVDAGDILLQRAVDISEHDTALTLNTKCYEAAIKSFAELIDGLADEKIVPRKQNIEERTFFPRFKRPANGGIITWNSSAEEISALVRALDFGDYPNPLGVPKLFVEKEYFIVSKLEILGSNAGSPPGTINEIGQDFLRISCADKEIKLTDILELDGRPISISDLTSRFGLSDGCVLREVSSKMAEKVNEFYKAACKSERYWVETLISSEPASAPFANISALSRSAEYRGLSITIPDEIGRSLAESKFGDYLVAAFAAFIGRLSDSDGFNIGYVDAEMKRKTVELNNITAVQTPLRFDIDRLQTFSEFFNSFENEIDSIKKHGLYSRDIAARYPLLRSEMESGGLPTLPVAVAAVTDFDDYQPSPDHELVFLITKNKLECRLVYSSSRFDKEDIEKLAGHFETFLKGIAADSQCQIAYLPLLEDAERHQLLTGWNQSQAEFPTDECIHQIFEKRAQEIPGAKAIICGNKYLSYAELDERSNQLARRLRRIGIGREAVIAVCFDRSIETVVGLLAILKAGGAYLPLDPAYPRDRIEFMLKDAGVQVLLTKQSLKPLMPQNECRILCLDADWDEIAQETTESLTTETDASNLAYVIYTSGSTGIPKGVEIEHKALLNLVSWHRRAYDIQPEDRATLLAGPAFDAAVWELWPYLASGAAIHIPDEEIRSTPRKLIKWLALQKITMCFMPTPLAEAVLEMQIPDGLSLRCLLTGGDRLHQISQNSLPFEVINHYGPTENTVVATRDLVEPGTESPPSIGRPIQNVQIYILDRFLCPVPVGITGEIYIGGDSLARGYLNRPDLTADRFVRHSFDGLSDQRLYRTGDRAEYLRDGRINFLDRVDNQVKIRGFRIELGEIETVLLSHPSVKEAVVIVREDRLGEKRLAAYFVTAGGQTVSIGELREFLNEKFPDYMVPAALVGLDELPLTRNGKIDRKALPIPPADLTDSDRIYVAHRDEWESKLVDIWETILDVRPIGVTDNFLELGGHSLQAVRMFAEVEATFDRSIPLATLFEAGTIEKLADILRQDTWAERETSIVPIQPNGTKPIFFCVHAKGGNVMFYNDLAKHLGTDQPFYGIQAKRLGGRQVGHSTVEKMAVFYINEMKSVQPEGPYYLGGSSFGGLAAFEIAQQLHRHGEKTALLALLDTGTPDYPKMLPSTTVFRAKIYDLISRVQQHRDSLQTLQSGDRKAYIISKLQKLKLKYRRKMNNTYKKTVRKFYIKTKGTGSIPKNYIQLEDQIWKAGQNYLPQVYPGKVTLFRASTQPMGIYPDPTLGWGDFVGGEFEILDVPGHHGSIVKEPYVRVLAEKLAKCIESASLHQERSEEIPEAAEVGRQEFAQSVG